MRIEYLKAKNFLCIGEEPLEIDFSKLGKIIMIKGKNLDYKEDTEDTEDAAEEEFHSNAAGKSTISEALVYALYGETIRKKLSQSDIINDTFKKRLEVEIIFSINGKRYRILRQRKPDTLQFWENEWTPENELTKTKPSTQKHIEEVIGMCHRAFVNIVCFGQHNDYNFLQCKPDEQRTIAESLLGLEIYNSYAATAKDEIKDLKASLKELSAGYEKLKTSKNLTESRIQQIKKQCAEWESACKSQIEQITNKITIATTALEASDVGQHLLKYEKAQEESTVLRDSIPDLESQQITIENALVEAKSKRSQIHEKRHEFVLKTKSHLHEIESLQKEIAKCQKEISGFKELKLGTQCPTCYSPIEPQHYKRHITLNENKIDGLNTKITQSQQHKVTDATQVGKYDKLLEQVDGALAAAVAKSDLINQKLNQSRSRLAILSKIQKPDASSQEMLLQQQIAQLEELRHAKQHEYAAGGPFVSILESTQSDLEVINDECLKQKKEMETIEEQIPYYEYWTKGFGDNGIRSFIIEGIVPALNARIAYWMHFLLNNKLTVKFDNKLNAKISSNRRDECTYFGTCGSERQRIDLAISQAFAHVMMLSTNTWPSLVFLDEVSDSIDKKGIKSIYNMICALAGEKQVFVITHNSDLSSMLDGADTIIMERRDEVTRRI